MSKFDGEPRNRRVDKFDPNQKKKGGQSWQKHERDTAKLFDGETTIGSGAIPFFKGDVKSDTFMIECKSTANKSLGIKASWLEKISEEAVMRKREPAMHFRFEAIKSKLCEKDWVMVSASTFKKMLGE